MLTARPLAQSVETVAAPGLWAATLGVILAILALVTVTSLPASARNEAAQLDAPTSVG